MWGIVICTFVDLGSNKVSSSSSSSRRMFDTLEKLLPQCEQVCLWDGGKRESAKLPGSVVCKQKQPQESLQPMVHSLILSTPTHPNLYIGTMFQYGK